MSDNVIRSCRQLGGDAPVCVVIETVHAYLSHVLASDISDGAKLTYAWVLSYLVKGMDLHTCSPLTEEEAGQVGEGFVFRRLVFLDELEEKGFLLVHEYPLLERAGEPKRQVFRVELINFLDQEGSGESPVSTLFLGGR